MTGEPSAKGSDHQLRQYWTHGEGAVKIGWGTPGDFDRCVTHLGKYVHDPQGLCAEYHHEATGMWPAEHAARERGKSDEAALLAQGAALLAEMAAKHLPGLHDQSTHGRRHGRGHGRAGHRISFDLLTPAQAQQMQDQMLGGETWSQSQTESLREYTSDRSETINALLYSPKTAASIPAHELDELTHITRNVHAAMRPTPKPVQVFRGVSRQGMGLKAGEDIEDAVGRKFQNAGFSSTAVQLESLMGATEMDHDAILVIDVPAGTPAAYVDSISEFQGEHELLLDAGMVFEYTRTGEEHNGWPVIHARVVPA